MILSARLLFLSAVLRVSSGEISLPYKSEGKCNNNSSEFYNKDAQMCCSRCKPGTRLETKCTKDKETVCSPCPNGQYSDKTNHYTNCFSCKKCADSKELMYSQSCSADTNAVCVCKPGSFCLLGSSRIDCKECKRHKSCKIGEGVIQKGTATANVQCERCPEGTFSSSQSSTEPCKPHKRCDGGLVLRPGNSTADTECGMKPSKAGFPQTTTTSKMPKNTRISPSAMRGKMQIEAYITPSLATSTSVTSSTAENLTTGPKPISAFIYTGIVVAVLLVLLPLTIMVIMCKLQTKKGLVMDAMADSIKPKPSPPASVTPERQCLLPGDRCQKEPSMTSSDSQPDSSQSHISGDWLEHTSQEESLHEPLSISSPLVNVSITTTISCQMNPTTASCSIPVSPSTLVPQADVSVPLSQEEVSISCQQEDGKEALQSVQESGLCA